MIKVKCPQCGKELQVDDKYAGKTGNCLHCRQKIKVPSGNVWKEEIGMEAVPPVMGTAPRPEIMSVDSRQSPPKIARKKPRTRTLVLSVVFVLTFVLYVNTFMDFRGKPTGSRAAAQTVPVYTLSATQLFSEYTDNAVAAEMKYDGKLLAVTGTVDSIGFDLLGTPYVTLKSGSVLFSVQCMFPDSEKIAISRLSKGQVVKIVGENSGKLGNIIIRKCVLQ